MFQYKMKENFQKKKKRWKFRADGNQQLVKTNMSLFAC